MYLTTTLWLIVAAAGANGTSRPQRAPLSEAVAAALPTVSLKHIDPIRVAYLEQTGPYWRVGPLLRQVVDYMAEHDMSGAVFVRYLDHPSKVTPDSLRCHVGFTVAEEQLPAAEFTYEDRGPETVASVVVEEHYVAPLRYYALLEEWSLARGYTLQGPITETYPDAVRARRGQLGRSRLVIQMSIDVARQAATPFSRSSTDETKAETRRPLPNATEQRSRLRALLPVIAAGVAGADVRTAPTTVSRKLPPPPPRASGGRHASDGARGTALRAVAHRVDELIADHHFVLAAEELLPATGPFPIGTRVWLGQVVMRVKAFAAGFERIYPNHEVKATELADAISRRYDTVFHDFVLAPVDQAIVRINVQTDPNAPTKLAILRELDALLGRLAVRGISAAAAMETLSSLLERVGNLIAGDQRPP